MSLEASERETVLVISDDAREWLVSSTRRQDITQFRKNPDFVIDREGTYDGTAFVEGRLPMGGISIRRKSAGGNTKTTGKARGTLTAAKCLQPTAAGTLCQAVAAKATGRCARHSA